MEVNIPNMKRNE